MQVPKTYTTFQVESENIHSILVITSDSYLLDTVPTYQEELFNFITHDDNIIVLAQANNRLVIASRFSIVANFRFINSIFQKVTELKRNYDIKLINPVSIQCYEVSSSGLLR